LDYRPLRGQALPQPPIHGVRIRRATLADLDALWCLETQAFETDRMSRRSLRRLLCVASAEIVIAEAGTEIAGAAVLLFRANSTIARCYSLAVARPYARRGIGLALMAAAEDTARKRQCAAVRTEVHEKNLAAAGLNRKAGYREVGRYREFYEDGGDALRFEKRLHQARRGVTA
jgi:[ribosomal protein S18]-alanine N-acetyltransferase